MKVLINADDFGISPSVSSAIIYGLKNELLDRTTMIVTSDYAVDSFKLAKKENLTPYIGLHLNLDEGKPLTENIKNFKEFCSSDGLFSGINANPIYIKDSALRKACEEEIAAQLSRFCEMGGELKHVDSHHYIHNKLSILSLLIPLARDYSFTSMRIACFYEADNAIKKIYKKYINRLISKHFDTSSLFAGNIQNFRNLSFVPGFKGVVEVMVHPDIVNGEYVDVLRKGKLYLPLNEIRK